MIFVCFISFLFTFTHMLNQISIINYLFINYVFVFVSPCLHLPNLQWNIENMSLIWVTHYKTRVSRVSNGCCEACRATTVDDSRHEGLTLSHPHWWHILFLQRYKWHWGLAQSDEQQSFVTGIMEENVMCLVYVYKQKGVTS